MTAEAENLNRALGHHQKGELEQAAKFYQEVLRVNPKNADALYLFGCLAYQAGNSAAARDLLQPAIVIAPGQAEYHHALGLALNALEDYDAAIHNFQLVRELDPQHLRVSKALAQAWYGKGCGENLRQEFAVAITCFTNALELEPDWLEARHNLGRALYEMGLVSDAFHHFKICAATNVAGSEHSRAMLAVIVPGVPEAGNDEILKTRRNWVRHDLPPATAVKSVAPPHSPLRVGYVSSFFHRDNWMKPVWGLINQHDRSKIQVHLLSDCERAAIKHGYTVQESDRYFDTSKMTNTEIAELVKHSGIDILVDLNGYSNMNRLPLFAQKVAPVVVGWFNMYATTGMSGFDYLIGDSDVVKANEEEFYSEKLMRVKGSYLTFDVAYPVPPVVARFRNEDEFVFGSLASQYKITDQVIEAWSKILRACPHSSLLLKNKQLGLVSAQAHLLARFATHGINSNRLHLEGPEPHFDFLKAYDRIDIALDTFPYNGGTTTTEAIWQGVPVVTFDGDRWASRTSASILRAAGLGEFVASDVDGYINLALRLGFGEPLPERLGLRTRLADSSACDTRSFAVQIEQLYLNCV